MESIDKLKAKFLKCTDSSWKMKQKRFNLILKKSYISPVSKLKKKILDFNQFARTTCKYTTRFWILVESCLFATIDMSQSSAWDKISGKTNIFSLMMKYAIFSETSKTKVNWILEFWLATRSFTSLTSKKMKNLQSSKNV